VEELEILLEKAERAIDTQSGHIMALVAQLQGYIDSGEEPSSAQGGGGVDQSALIEKLQGDIHSLQLELDEEREESSRKDKESAALAEMLSEKEGVLAEAGQVMQDAQTLYDNAKARVDVLAHEKAKLHGELKSVLSERSDDVAKHKFQMEEMQVNLETAHLENQKLRAEIAEMTGDDMRAAPASGAVTGIPKAEERANSPLPPPVPQGKDHKDQGLGRRGSSDAANTSSRSAANAAKKLNLTAHRAEVEESIGILKQLLHVTLGQCFLVILLLFTGAHHYGVLVS
jgi:chromosome segregation ATPase